MGHQFYLFKMTYFFDLFSEQISDYQATWKKDFGNHKVTGTSHQYHLYFTDLELLEIGLPKIPKIDKENTEVRWINRLTSILPHESSRRDINTLQYYKYINAMFGEYYKEHGIRRYDDQFLKYIIDNELEDEPL